MSLTASSRLLNGAHARILKFGIIGGVGFAVDAGVLQVLFWAGMRAVLARGISFPLAVTATWLLNRRFTFSDRASRPIKSGFALYIAGQIGGALINLGVFVVAIQAWPALAVYPVAPLALGSMAGLVFNYSWANLLVFRKQSSG